MKLPGRYVFVILFLFAACSSATASSSSPYRLSFVIQPSDILVGSSLFATTVLTHPTKSLISSNAVQFQILDGQNRPAPGTSVLPVTTDSRGLAIFADTVLLPGRGYALVASCGPAVIRSRPFDVIATEPEITPQPVVPEPLEPAAAERHSILLNIPTTKKRSVSAPPPPVRIHNPNLGQARETIVPPLPPKEDAVRVIPVRVVPSSFDLVLSAPPGVPQDVEVRVISIPNPAPGNAANGTPF